MSSAPGTTAMAEEWIAVQGGTFVRASFDLPALLYDTDLLHLYDALLAEDLYDLWQRYEQDFATFNYSP